MHFPIPSVILLQLQCGSPELCSDLAKWSKSVDIRSHRLRAQVVHSYSLGGADVDHGFLVGLLPDGISIGLSVFARLTGVPINTDHET